MEDLRFVFNALHFNSNPKNLYHYQFDDEFVITCQEDIPDVLKAVEHDFVKNGKRQFAYTLCYAVQGATINTVPHPTSSIYPVAYQDDDGLKHESKTFTYEWLVSLKCYTLVFIDYANEKIYKANIWDENANLAYNHFIKNINIVDVPPVVLNAEKIVEDSVNTITSLMYQNSLTVEQASFIYDLRNSNTARKKVAIRFKQALMEEALVRMPDETTAQSYYFEGYRNAKNALCENTFDMQLTSMVDRLTAYYVCKAGYIAHEAGNGSYTGTEVAKKIGTEIYELVK